MGAQVPILLKDSPVLYIVGAQAPILFRKVVSWLVSEPRRDYRILYIVGAQAPILWKKDYPIPYIRGAQVPIVLKDSPVLYIVCA